MWSSVAGVWAIRVEKQVVRVTDGDAEANVFAGLPATGPPLPVRSSVCPGRHDHRPVLRRRRRRRIPQPRGGRRRATAAAPGRRRRVADLPERARVGLPRRQHGAVTQAQRRPHQDLQVH